MKSRFVIIFFFTVLTATMFYPVFVKGRLPFPGDLLLAEYQPWKSYSYNGIAPGGIPNKAQYFDAIRQMYPWQSLVTNTMYKQQFPLWNSYNFSGSPLFANIQSAILYPLKFIYLIFPQPLAWTVLIMLQPLLSLLFMFWYIKTVNGSTKAALVSSYSYAFCLFATSFLEYNTIDHILYLLPLSLVCIEHLLTRFEKKYSVLFIMSVVMAFLAGHIQIFTGFAEFILFYTSIRLMFQNKQTDKLKIFVDISVLFILAIGICAVQLLPTLELIMQSARTNQPYIFLINHLLIQPYQLVLYIIPDLFGNPANRNYLLSDSYPTKTLYIGLIPFILALTTIWSVKKNEIITTFWLLFVIFGLFIIRSPISTLLYKIPLPFISTSSPSNYIFLLSASLSVLAGFGIDVINKKNSTLITRILSVLLAIFITTFLVGKLFHIAISMKNYLYSFGLFISVSAIILVQLYIPKARSVCLIILFFLTFADLFYFFHKFNPFVPISYIYPNNQMVTWLQTIPKFDRVWGYGSAGLQENIASQLQYYSAEGYDPLYPKRYGQLIQSSKDGTIQTIFTNLTRSDAVIYPGWGETDMASNPYRQKMLALTGTQYIVTRVEDPISERTFPLSLFDLTDQFDGWWIFRYKQALPRTFITNRYELFSSDTEFQQKFYNPAFDPKTTLLLEKKPDILLSDTSLVATANIQSLNANNITISATSDQSALLFLSDTYYPGWNAYVDNLHTPIYRAHYAFRAIVMPKGKHRIEFRYEPTSFSLGLIISIACIMLTGIYLLFKKSHAK